MPRFIQTDRVVVSDDAGNKVYLRRKMDFGTVSRVQAGVPTEGVVSLYKHNILDWEGPDFKDRNGKKLPCTPETIETLDMDDPFWEQVGDKIVELNPQLKGKRGDDAESPLSSTTATVPTSTVNGTARQEDLASMSV